MATEKNDVEHEWVRNQVLSDNRVKSPWYTVPYTGKPRKPEKIK
jgi:hypothetical protein